MKNKKKVYIVPHSHWDREWYFTIEDSNILLSENMLHLMDVLENDKSFDSYTFDGQLSIVEEFIKIYPEEKDRLKKLIKEKRIIVGPWYTQTDSLLVNKESIIRNLLYGTRIGQEYGNYMRVGYLPDIFGQNSYLPSIFKGFDINHSVFQRGIYDEGLDGNLNFKWESPDGEIVNSNNIYLGYGPGKFLSSDDTYINEKLIPMLEKLDSLNKDSDCILLPSGGDQVLIRDHFPKTIKEINQKQDRYELILSDYETFMKNVPNKALNNKVGGELIACQKSRIHNTIKSQRYDIKKLNNTVENKMLYILEPLSIIGKSLGLKYKTKWIDDMWKLLFDVHAHDSIGGCNSDDTNRDIINRLKKVNNMCDNLIHITKKQITMAISKFLSKENILVLFNTKTSTLDEMIEAVIFTKEKEFKLTTLEGDNVEFSAVNQEFISGGKQVMVTADGEKEVELPGYYRSEVKISNISVTAIGFLTLLIEEGSFNTINVIKSVKELFIENSNYRLEFENNNISLINKINGEKIYDLIYFENCGDFGDSYDFSPLKDDEVIKIDKVEIIDVLKSKEIQQIKIKHSIRLPKDLEERKRKINSQLLEVYTVLEVRKKENFIRVKHNLDNNIKDHRLRVIMNTQIVANTSISDQGFSTIKRENKNKYIDNWKYLKFAEAPVSIYGMENFAAIKDNEKIFGVITKGIKEYEIINNSQMALTLYRSTGLLGRDNLDWRPGRASGINNKVVYTPQAQLQEALEFEYAIYFNEAKNGELELFEATDKFIKKYTTYQKQSLNLFEERLERFEIPQTLNLNSSKYSLFEVINENVFVSACKESYDKDGIILRIFNPSDEDVSVRINSDYIEKMVFTNLYERELDKVENQIKIPPKGYVSIKLSGGDR